MKTRGSRLLLLVILLFNAVDAALSVWLIQLEAVAVEANPLMSHVMEWGIAPFLVVKMVLASLGCTLLWRFRQRTLAKWGIVLCFMAYMILILYYLQALSGSCI